MIPFFFLPSDSSSFLALPMSSVTGTPASRVARAWKLLFQRVAPFSAPPAWFMAGGVTGLICFKISKRYSSYRLFRGLIGQREAGGRPAAEMIEAISY